MTTYTDRPSTVLIIKLKNPGAAPSGLPLTLTHLVGSVVGETQVFDANLVKFDFVHNEATLPVVAGERCSFILSSMTLKINGTSEDVTYQATDKPLLIPFNSAKKQQSLVAPEENAVSMDLIGGKEAIEKAANAGLPATLWFAGIASPYVDAAVGIDFTRSQVIENVKH